MNSRIDHVVVPHNQYAIVIRFWISCQQCLGMSSNFERLCQYTWHVYVIYRRPNISCTCFDRSPRTIQLFDETGRIVSRLFITTMTSNSGLRCTNSVSLLVCSIVSISRTPPGDIEGSPDRTVTGTKDIHLFTTRAWVLKRLTTAGYS